MGEVRFSVPVKCDIHSTVMEGFKYVSNLPNCQDEEICGVLQSAATMEGTLVQRTRYASWPPGLFCFGRAGQFPPTDQLDFLLSQYFSELVAGEKIIVSLPPGRSPRGALPRGGAQFVIVVSRMDD